MTDATNIAQLVTFIEENLRASQTSGLQFVDPRHYRERLISKQNHIVFGRRGAGKSTLISSLRHNKDRIVIELNLEDYKDITFPNIILQVLALSFRALLNSIKKQTPWYRPKIKSYRLQKELIKQERVLLKLIKEPDEQEQTVVTRSSSQLHGDVKAPAQLGETGFGASRGSETEVSASRAINKLSVLKNSIADYKRIISETSKECSGKPIFLVLDDFYFVDKNIQPDLIDYFHRLAKGSNLYLKIATIKHRSVLYRRSRISYVGVELGHDIYDIDLDYTFENFKELQNFMRQILDGSISESNASISSDDLFSGDGFKQLCLASGGVPRDFLFLFVRLANNVLLTNKGKIGKVPVNEEAITNITSKLDSLKQDSGNEDEILEDYLNHIRTTIYKEKRTNIFLIAKPDLDQLPQSRQAIRELVDLRLIHIIDKNTSSAPSDGLRYEAYLLDVGLYENSRPRNFKQIEPGIADSKSRKDFIRAAPRLSLAAIETIIANQGHQLNLFPTDDTLKKLD